MNQTNCEIIILTLILVTVFYWSQFFCIIQSETTFQNEYGRMCCKGSNIHYGSHVSLNHQSMPIYYAVISPDQ